MDVECLVRLKCSVPVDKHGDLLRCLDRGKVQRARVQLIVAISQRCGAILRRKVDGRVEPGAACPGNCEYIRSRTTVALRVRDVVNRKRWWWNSRGETLRELRRISVGIGRRRRYYVRIIQRRGIERE